MTLIEKNLYSQIHPLRLFTDWTTGLYACYLLWYQDLVAAMITAFIPSLIVSLVIVRFVDLEKVKNSAFGRYFKRTYNRTVDLTRFGGFIIMSGGAWMQNAPAVAVGLAVILGTWTFGLFTKK